MKRLALFFSFRISLLEWKTLGSLEREVALYNAHASFFDEIYFFTYGGSDDLACRSSLAPNIIVVPVPFLRTGGKALVLFPLMAAYSILMPLIHRKRIRKADILKTNQVPGSWSAVLSKVLFGKKLVFRIGYVWSFIAKKNKEIVFKRLIKRAVERLAYRACDVCICSSADDFKKLTNKSSLGGKDRLIPNYVDTRLFVRHEGREKEGGICFVGRLEEEKNLFILFDAIRSLDCHLTVVGSGGLKKELMEKVRQNSLNVTFRDNIPHAQLPALFNEHPIFILPSRYEGTPKALLEAMSCERAVIGTNVEGIKNIITHEKNGLLADVSPAALEEAISRLLGDGSLRRRLGQEARQTIEKGFSLASAIELEQDIYRDL